jgi:Tol biopolymer transport system component
MDKFGQNKKNLTRNPACDVMPQVSADAKWIFFLSDHSGNFQIWQMDTQGAGLRQVTNSKTDIQDLSIYTKVR